MGRYKVVVGEEFEIETAKVEVEKAKPSVDTKIVEVMQRYWLALIILGFVGIFLVGAALVGLYRNDYSGLQAVYNVAVIPATAIVSFYFNYKPHSARE